MKNLTLPNLFLLLFGILVYSFFTSVTYQKIAQLDQNPQEHEELVKLAHHALSLSRPATAFACGERLQELATQSPENSLLLHDGTTLKGLALLQQGKLEEAKAALTQASNYLASIPFDERHPKPNYSLVQEFAFRGELEAVSNYLAKLPKGLLSNPDFADKELLKRYYARGLMPIIS